MVKIRPRDGGWQYDIIFRWPDGTRHRERKQAPVTGKAAAQRWAEERERVLLRNGSEFPKKEIQANNAVPTLAAFWPRVVRDHYKADRKKASTTETAESIYKNHIAPHLGARRLDAITTADIAALKGRLKDAKPKTVNNVLSVLSRALRCAVAWDVIRVVPCRFGLLRVVEDEMPFYELDEFRRLVTAARFHARVHLLVLLAGSAGLRRGEIIALKWTDVDLVRGQIVLARAIWRRIEDTPKGNRGRVIPLTPELLAALKAARGIGERVLYSERGEELSNRTIRNWLARAQRKANLVANGGVHILRHTFCSHLAMAGVPAITIKELAGHKSLKTTMRYMHLSPANKGTAMATLAKFYRTAPADTARAVPTG